MGQFQRHVFVCTTGKTCAAQDGLKTWEAMRDATHAAGLKGVVRVNQAGCMSQCGHGPMVAVYPDDVWYHAVDAAKGELIVAEHIVGGTPVEALRYIAPPGENKLPKEQRPA
ncbi:MAG: (2Fe-2S) ferredoxin domain-containing protein [Gemmatimonadaceae bacterium]|nr:(2Fe-2S) ferredoxin domain-containing protein [Gemmatimonadaceae bacterium]